MVKPTKPSSKSVTISAADIEFDDSGRAFIANSEAMASLRDSLSAGAEAIKNIGCCSAALEGGQRIDPKDLNSLMSEAIKNIGCCSAV